jgi:hypothetical protein
MSMFKWSNNHYTTAVQENLLMESKIVYFN